MNNIVATPNGRSGFSLAPQSLDEALRFADILSKSSIVPKDYQGSPGNILVAVQWGAELGLALAWEADDQAVASALDQLIVGDREAIVSSEWLGELDPDQWRRLLDLLVARTSSRRVVVVVRDVYPLVQARYSQAVKGEGFSGGFVDFARAHLPKLRNMAQVLATMRESLNADEFTVLHYEAIRGDLVRSLLAAGGIPAGSLDLSPGGSSAKPRNRSLSPGEITLLRRVNSELGADQAPMLAHLLEDRSGPSSGRQVLDDEALELLTQQFSSEVEAINAVHFADSRTLEIFGSLSGEVASPDAQSVSEDERSAAGFLLAELSSPVNRIRFRRIRKMLESLAG